MTKQSTLLIVGIATLILIGMSSWVVVITQQPNPGFKDAAATITFITGAAVGSLSRVV